MPLRFQQSGLGRAVKVVRVQGRSRPAGCRIERGDLDKTTHSPTGARIQVPRWYVCMARSGMARRAGQREAWDDESVWILSASAIKPYYAEDG